MHGLGNDFVVIDARRERLEVDAARAQAIADRRTGVGCDQLIVIEPPRSAGADAFMRILNPDGSEVGACGNGTRCVADILMRDSGGERVVIETLAGLLDARRAEGGRVRVDMGPARLDWRAVPLARDCDTLHAPVSVGPLGDPACCSMGNPHATFFVPDVAAIDLSSVGPLVEHHPMFPERVNVGVAQILDRRRIRFRVWERGVGITRACGSGACATAVNSARRGLTERRVTIVLDGGELEIEWRADGHVLMTGPVAASFTGELAPS
ncbi:MAG: diaminopimelate epimerase [Alphaproteobacteria bacterium]|nr:diaminopimelate epimerase [Alphaproteobacteria bacterium]